MILKYSHRLYLLFPIPMSWLRRSSHLDIMLLFEVSINLRYLYIYCTYMYLEYKTDSSTISRNIPNYFLEYVYLRYWEGNLKLRTSFSYWTNSDYRLHYENLSQSFPNSQSISIINNLAWEKFKDLWPMFSPR